MYPPLPPSLRSPPRIASRYGVLNRADVRIRNKGEGAEADLVTVVERTAECVRVIGAVAGVGLAIDQHRAVGVSRIQVLGPAADIQVSEDTHQIDPKPVHMVFAGPIIQ